MFDAKKYRKAVIGLERDKERMALLSDATREFQGEDGITAIARLNLAELFAVEPSMRGPELEKHLSSVEATLNPLVKKSRQPAQLLKRLLGLLRQSGEPVHTPEFWAGLAKARVRALREQLAEFARAVAQERPLKVVLAAQVAEQAAGAGLAGVTEQELVKALSDHGVRVTSDFEVPKIIVHPSVGKVTGFPEFRTIVDVLTRPERHGDIRVVDELAFGEPLCRPGQEAVREAKERLERQEARVDEKARQAAQNALSSLATDYASPEKLHALALATLARTTEELLQRGLPLPIVRDELVKRGVHKVDAARLVTKLSATTQVLNLNDVTERLASGALGEARRLLDALPVQEGEEPGERDRVTAQVEAAEKKKDDSVARYESAVRARDYVAAATALRDALAVDPQDEELRARLGRLPPLPPANVVTRTEGRSLTVSWTADGEESVRYTVVRTTGGVPANREDGDLLAGDLDRTLFRDENPPVGTRVRYSVFATRDGSLYSDPASAVCVVLPPPFDLAASAGETDVSLSWGTPPEAADVIVTRTAPDGGQHKHRPSTPGQLSATGLVTGTRYRFSVQAVYLLAGGGRQVSEAVEADATPRGAIRAVDDLHVESVDGGHRASWASIAGYPVELWVLPVAAQVGSGDRLSQAELASLRGSRLTLRPGGGADGRTVREFDTLENVSLLVPVTLDGDGGLAGTPRITGSAPSVRTPTAERLGDQLRLSWQWPRGDYLIEVGWTSGGHRASRRFSRTRYNEEGGARIPEADGISDVTLATVVRAGTREWVSSPVPVPVSGTAPVVRYSLAVKRSRLSGRGTARVTVESPAFGGAVRSLTVLKEAKFMPASSQDGTVVDRRLLDFTEQRSLTYELNLGRVTAPFWVRLFPEPDSAVRFEDPPTSQMRG